MKILISLLIAIGFLLALNYGINKSLDNRCEYYKTLPHYQEDKTLVNLCK